MGFSKLVAEVDWRLNNEHIELAAKLPAISYEVVKATSIK